MIEFGPGGKRQHQADPVAIKEGQIRRHAEKVLHAELVAIEVNGTINVMRVNGDLLDCGKTEVMDSCHKGFLVCLTANKRMAASLVTIVCYEAKKLYTMTPLTRTGSPQSFVGENLDNLAARTELDCSSGCPLIAIAETTFPDSSITT